MYSQIHGIKRQVVMWNYAAVMARIADGLDCSDVLCDIADHLDMDAIKKAVVDKCEMNEIADRVVSMLPSDFMDDLAIQAAREFIDETK